MCSNVSHAAKTYRLGKNAVVLLEIYRYTSSFGFVFGLDFGYGIVEQFRPESYLAGWAVSLTSVSAWVWV
nr:hypothetical protein HmN_000731500 [Hymenolepis microstoma]CDS27280.1 hypothetical protein HmN_000731600 [Hymenolepis microstoma]